MAVPIPAHNPTDALGIPTQIVLTGTNVVRTVGREYFVPLSVSATSPNFATVAITATLKDAAGTTYTDATISTVTTFALTNNVATVTVSATNLNTLFAPQQKVNLTLVTNTLVNGIVTLLTVTASTITFAFTHADIASGADTGTFVNANVVTFVSRDLAQATVSGSTITSVAPGQADIDVYYNCFDVASPSAGVVAGRIYSVLTVSVGV